MSSERNRKAAFVRLTCLALLSCQLVCPGCGRGYRNSLAHPEALVVCPDATRIAYTRSKGIDQLSYQVAIEYPADAVLSSISEQLKDKEFRALAEDYWNPGLQSSQVRGWTQFIDATVSPEARVDQWLGEWQNRVGDVVWYSLQYRYPPGDRHTLTVQAGFIPASLTKNVSRPTNTQR